MKDDSAPKPPAPWNDAVQAGILDGGRVPGTGTTRYGAHYSPSYLRNNFGICLKEEDVGFGKRCCLFDEKGDVHCQMKACISHGYDTSVCAANGSPTDLFFKRWRASNLPTIALGTQSCDDSSTCDLIDIPYQVCSETPMVLPPCPVKDDYDSRMGQWKVASENYYSNNYDTPTLPFEWSKNPIFVHLVNRINDNS